MCMNVLFEQSLFRCRYHPRDGWQWWHVHCLNKVFTQINCCGHKFEYWMFCKNNWEMFIPEGYYTL